MAEDIDKMGLENYTQGICGFTSTLYAVYVNQLRLQASLASALNVTDRQYRMRAEIKTFLVMMKAAGRNDVLDAITNFTRGFNGIYAAWSVDSYIGFINSTVSSFASGAVTGLDNRNYAIAMPPRALMEYMKLCWDLKPALITKATDSSNVILGLTTDAAAPTNVNWDNPTQLKHYVYRGLDGKIYSWGQQFADMTALNVRRTPPYIIMCAITVN